jgi:hypothetical protein
MELGVRPFALRSYKVLRKTATKTIHKTGTQQNTTRRIACKSLVLHPLKQSLIEVERKWRRKTPHQRRKFFITIEHR